MTAREITETDESSKTEKGWLREIAYQLATLNESKPQPLQVGQKKIR
jgi:ubiquitin